MNGNFPTTTIGWIAIATGTAVILAVVFITLMYTVNMGFGPVNDVFNGIVGISSAILTWMLYAEYHTKPTLVSHFVLGLALIGAIFVLIGSVLVFFKFTGWVLAGLYTGMGVAMIGFSLVAFCIFMLQKGTLPNNLVIFGLVTGILMAFGVFVLPGIPAGIDGLETVPWYLKVATVSGLGIYLTYPIWCIWLGRVLLQK